MKKFDLKKKIAALMFSFFVFMLPLFTVIANSSSSLFSAAAAYSGDGEAQAAAAVVDTAVAVGIYTSFLCGVQGLVAIVAAG